MRTVKHMDELVNAMRESLLVISAHTQHLIHRQSLWHHDTDDLLAIHEAAERAAALLHLVEPEPADDNDSEGRQSDADMSCNPSGSSSGSSLIDKSL